MKMVKHDMEAHFVLSGAPVPLKAGEKHCPFCAGYGWNPSTENNGDAIRCSECAGTGILD